MARKKKETTQGTSEQLPVENISQDTQNQTEESQNETSKQAMDELIALDQELELYTTPEAPTITLEEEYNETDTEVAITENVAVNESEEVLEGIPALQEGFWEAETKRIQETVAKYTEGGAWNEEPSGIISGSLENLEDFKFNDKPEVIEHFLFNGQNQPIPATLIVIREMRLQNLVDKVLYVANLGGDLFPQGIRLDSAPYICKVLLPASLVEKYNNLEDKLVYDENKGYLDLVVKAANSPTFLKRLFKVGKKGAIIAPNKLVTKVAGFAVSLKSLFPVEADGSVSVGVDKPIYSVDDLKAMKSESLKIVSSWYGLPWENSNQARILIRKAQEGK